MRASRTLRTHYLRCGRPADGRVVAEGDYDRYRRGHFDPVVTAVGFAPGAHTPKDLRDTFASQLLTAGVPLGSSAGS